MIEIVVTPLGLKAPGRFEARHGDRVILKSSRQPLLDAARVFLAEGVQPDTRIGMRHADSTHFALFSNIGAAAKLTVEEDNVTRFRAWRGPETAVAASPMRKNGE